MSIETWIQQLSQEFHLEEWVQPQEGGQYLISFADDIDMHIIPTSQGCLLKGIIGPCPQVKQEEFFAKALEGNLFGKGTRQAAIGLNEEGKLVTLSLEVDYNHSYKEFKEKVEDFVTMIEHWRKEALQHQ